jgi:ribonuclease-3
MSILYRWKRFFGRLRQRPAPLLPAASEEEVAAVLKACQEELHIDFRDPQLLRRALTHRSFLGGESDHLPASNERLEFLGDAVLELVVIEHLFRRFPDDREGELTQKKSVLVSKPVLAIRADRLGLGRHVLLSPAERESGGAARRSILADAFEALLGAIYLDQGLDTAAAFVHRWLLADTDSILRDTDKQNFKSILQERVQASQRVHPRYRVRREEGPDHQKSFTVEVVVRGRVLGVGHGFNKKEAEQQAARQALDSPELPDLTDGP